MFGSLVYCLTFVLTNWNKGMTMTNKQRKLKYIRTKNAIRKYGYRSITKCSSKVAFDHDFIQLYVVGGCIKELKDKYNITSNKVEVTKDLDCEDLDNDTITIKVKIT